MPSTLSLRQGFSMVWYSPSRSGWLSSKLQGHACLCFSVTEPKMSSFLSIVLIFARLTSYYFYHCLQLDIGIYDKLVYVKSVTQVQKLQDGHLGDHRLNFTILRSGTQGVSVSMHTFPGLPCSFPVSALCFHSGAKVSGYVTKEQEPRNT